MSTKDPQLSQRVLLLLFNNNKIWSLYSFPFATSLCHKLFLTLTKHTRIHSRGEKSTEDNVFSFRFLCKQWQLLT